MSLDPLHDHAQQTQTAFTAVFKDGYYIRNLFDHLRQTNSEGNFVFTSEGISYLCRGHEGRLFNEIKLHGAKLTEYMYNSKVERTIVGVKMVDLRSVSKNITKKDTMRLYKNSGENTLYIDIISRAKGTEGHITKASILFKDVPEEDVEPPEVDSPDLVQIQTNAAIFYKTCTNMGQVKNEWVNVIMLPQGFVIESCSNSIVRKKEEYGVVPKDTVLHEADGTPAFPHLRVPVGVMKSLSKLNNISVSNILMIYLDTNGVLSAETDIGGSYGYLRVHLCRGSLS